MRPWVRAGTLAGGENVSQMVFGAGLVCSGIAFFAKYGRWGVAASRAARFRGARSFAGSFVATLRAAFGGLSHFVRFERWLRRPASTNFLHRSVKPGGRFKFVVEKSSCWRDASTSARDERAPRRSCTDQADSRRRIW